MDQLDNTIVAIVKQVDGLMKQAETTYGILVDSVVRGDIRDLRSIESVMDGLAGFAGYPPCRALYEKLCAYVSSIDPQLVEEHRAAVFPDPDTSSL